VSSFPVHLPPDLAASAGQRSGLLLTAIEDDSPAARAGFTVGDVLLALDGTAVGHMCDLLPLLEEDRIGDVATARVARGGALQDLKVTIGARSSGQREARSP
jgi:serine protease Do